VTSRAPPPLAGQKQAAGGEDAASGDATLAEVERARILLARGERSAARASLIPLARAGGRTGRAALALLATLDESEGDRELAIARWQAILADQIDDDEAWTHLRRLGQAAGASAPALTAGPAGTAPTLDSGAGVRLHRFEIVGELGRGTFATVYRARDRALHLELALKVLHPRSGGAGRGDLASADRAFFAEARAIASLRHPGIVAIYDIDAEARTLVMELVPGGTLRERLRQFPAGASARGGLPASELDLLAERLPAAVAHLHAHGIVHGDLSPRNVLLRTAGDPVVIDFGGVHLGDPGDQPAGTPLYLAPEQFAGGSISAAADLFAVGAILWEAASGRPLRSREDLMAGRTAPRPLPAEIAAATPPAITDLITALTRVEPQRRRDALPAPTTTRPRDREA
jgi:hypothetical protein